MLTQINSIINYTSCKDQKYTLWFLIYLYIIKDGVQTFLINLSLYLNMLLTIKVLSISMANKFNLINSKEMFKYSKLNS